MHVFFSQTYTYSKARCNDFTHEALKKEFCVHIFPAFFDRVLLSKHNGIYFNDFNSLYCYGYYFCIFFAPEKTMLSTVFTVSAQNVVYTWHDTKRCLCTKPYEFFFHVVWNASRALLHSFCLFATFFLPEKLIDPIANMRNFYVSCISFE